MLTTVAVIASAYLAVVVVAFAFQNQLLFMPSSQIVATPDRLGMDYETVYAETSDGERLYGWWMPASGTPRGTVLFFHGNAGNISGRIQSAHQFHRLNLNVLLVDYRGYGQSTGSPGEEGLYRDAEAIWRLAMEEKGVDPGNLILFGRSLGGAPATWLATQVEARALVLESAFTSVPDIAAHHYPFLPVRLLSQIQFDSLSRIDGVGMPLLVMHSPDDEVVPYEHGRRLYEAANEPKQFLELRGGHNDGYLVSEEARLEAMRRVVAVE